MFWFQEGEKIGTFGQNIYPCSLCLTMCLPYFQSSGLYVLLSLSFLITLDQTDSHHFQNIDALFYDYVCHQFDIIVNIFYLRLNLYVDFEH